MYMYGAAQNVLIKQNTIHGVEKSLGTSGASNVLFADNTIDRINYDVAPGDRLIYGVNTISPRDVVIPTKVSVLQNTQFYKNGQIELH